MRREVCPPPRLVHWAHKTKARDRCDVVGSLWGVTGALLIFAAVLVVLAFAAFSAHPSTRTGMFNAYAASVQAWRLNNSSRETSFATASLWFDITPAVPPPPSPTPPPLRQQLTLCRNCSGTVWERLPSNLMYEPVSFWGAVAATDSFDPWVTHLLRIWAEDLHTNVTTLVVVQAFSVFVRSETFDLSRPSSGRQVTCSEAAAVCAQVAITTTNAGAATLVAARDAGSGGVGCGTQTVARNIMRACPASFLNITMETKILQVEVRLAADPWVVLGFLSNSQWRFGAPEDEGEGRRALLQGAWVCFPLGVCGAVLLGGFSWLARVQCHVCLPMLVDSAEEAEEQEEGEL